MIAGHISVDVPHFRTSVPALVDDLSLSRFLQNTGLAYQAHFVQLCEIVISKKNLEL